MANVRAVQGGWWYPEAVYLVKGLWNLLIEAIRTPPSVHLVLERLRE